MKRKPTIKEIERALGIDKVKSSVVLPPCPEDDEHFRPMYEEGLRKLYEELQAEAD